MRALEKIHIDELSLLESTYELIRQQVTEELSVFLDQPFMVEVSIDKKFGQCVTITVRGETGSVITEALGNYAFELVVPTA